MAVKYKEYKPEEHTWSDEVKNAQGTADYWNKQQLQNFTYDDFKNSQRTEDFWNRYNSLQGPGDFSFSKQQGMDDIWNQIQNREKFSYDVNGDALYQQYKDQYINQGKMAMMDTMGQAAAMTGGYGNSYAQSVGQQAYQGYMQQLTDKIPELYSLAMSKYQMEGDELKDKYGLYSDQFNREYGMHRDAVSDYQTERGHLSDMWANSHAMDMDVYNAGFNKALAENESINSNITSNRSYYTDVYNTLKNTEWGQYMDNETLKKLAIEVANDNLYKEEQTRIADEQQDLAEDKFEWEKDQSDLAAENAALKNQYVVDNKAANKVAGGIISEEEFMEKAKAGIGRSEGGGFLGLPSFSRNYVYNGVTYDSYTDYIEETIKSAYEAGDINEATVNALLEKYNL